MLAILHDAMKNQRSGYALILLAATLWGTLGIFYKFLNANSHISGVEIVFWRALISSLFSFLILLIWRRKGISIASQDLGLFFAMGIMGIAGFYLVYIFAITSIGMGIASVLLYSAPVWVAVYGVLFQGELLNRHKVVALILSIVGMILISEIYNTNRDNFSALGLLAGLGSGIGYAAYIIINKRITLRGYDAWTVNAYGIGIGALVLLLFQDPTQLRITLTTPSVSIWLLVLGIVPTLGGGLVFYTGLQKVPAVNASIVATFEPVVAVILGWVIFAEKFSITQVLGGILILSAVILIQFPQTN